jgi:hypothetical protein
VEVAKILREVRFSDGFAVPLDMKAPAKVRGRHIRSRLHFAKISVKKTVGVFSGGQGPVAHSERPQVQKADLSYKGCAMCLDGIGE